MRQFRSDLAAIYTEAGLEDMFQSQEPERFIGFNLVRMVHGVIVARQGDPFAVILEQQKRLIICAVDLYLDSFTSDFTPERELLIEVMYDKWEFVKIPWGTDPVADAAERARGSQQLVPGTYATQAQHDLASFIWRILCFLPLAHDGTVFLSARKAGELYGTNEITANRAIHALLKNGVIHEQFKGRGARASRYRILRRVTEKRKKRSH